MMDSTSVALLLVTASISFGIGRAIMTARKKKQAARQQLLADIAAKAASNAPPGPPSSNKSKRKRESQATLGKLEQVDRLERLQRLQRLQPAAQGQKTPPL